MNDSAERMTYFISANEVSELHRFSTLPFNTSK